MSTKIDLSTLTADQIKELMSQSKQVLKERKASHGIEALQSSMDQYEEKMERATKNMIGCLVNMASLTASDKTKDEVALYTIAKFYNNQGKNLNKIISDLKAMKKNGVNDNGALMLKSMFNASPKMVRTSTYTTAQKMVGKETNKDGTLKWADINKDGKEILLKPSKKADEDTPMGKRAYAMYQRVLEVQKTLDSKKRKASDDEESETESVSGQVSDVPPPSKGKGKGKGRGTKKQKR